MSSPIVLVVNLYLQAGHEQEFREFEMKAARIMGSHGGRIEHVLRPSASLSGEPLPHEIHLVSFPSVEHFDSYRSDPLLAELAPLRALAIARTTIVMGNEIEPYV